MKNKKNVIFIINAPIMGGAEIYLINLITNLDKDLFRPVAVGAIDSPVMVELKKQGVEVMYIDVGPRLGLCNMFDILKWPIYILRITLLLKRSGRSRPVDVVHLQSRKEQILGTIAARLAGAPVVWTEHDVVYDVYKGSKRFISYFYALIGKSFVRKISIFSAQSFESLIKLGFKKDRLLLIPIGINISRYAGISKRNSDRSPQVLGCICRFEIYKGLDLLIKAFHNIVAEYPHMRLILAGNGPDAPRLENLVKSLGLSEKIRFTGYVEHAAIPDILEEIDIFVHPSSRDGTPLSIIEALAAGKFVIATDVGGVSSLVEDFVTGLLVPSGSSENIAQSILWAVRNWKRAKDIALEGKKSVSHKHDVRSMARSLEDVFRSL